MRPVADVAAPSSGRTMDSIDGDGGVVDRARMESETLFPEDIKSRTYYVFIVNIVNE